MKLILKDVKELELIDDEVAGMSEEVGWIDLDVLYCGVCRTDAKLWEHGHRDLVLPCVPGHEIVAEFEGNYYAVWPGVTCGKCEYCIGGDVNLCNAIRIVGFNVDGGFSSKISVPKTCLLPLPEGLLLPNACLAEPLGCVINAFKKLDMVAGSRILIYGAGTLGLLSALVAKRYGVIPVVLEVSDQKIQKAKGFVKSSLIKIVKDLPVGDFDCVLSACNDVDAFNDSFLRVKKGGGIVYFSGLGNGFSINAKILNLIHYKEIALKGAYGLTLDDMKSALRFLKDISLEADLLIEEIISPCDVVGILPEVARGMAYRYIIDFTAGSR